MNSHCLNSKPSIEGVEQSIERIFSELDKQSNGQLHYHEYNKVVENETPKEQKLIQIDN